MDVWLLSYIALWILVLVQGVLLIILLRHIGVVYLGTREGISRDGLSVGDRAPHFVALRPDGSSTSLPDLLDRQWLVLVFAAPACPDCFDMVPALKAMQQEFDGLVRVAILIRADRDEARAIPEFRAQLIDLLAVGPSDVAQAYRVRVSPFAHVIDQVGVVRAKGLINGRPQVEHLLLSAGLSHPMTEVHGRHEHVTAEAGG